MSFKSQEYNVNSFNVSVNEKNFRLEQDVSAYKDYAAESRLQDEHAHSKRQYRSFAIIPDIVAIDILAKYGIDIHDPLTMKDTALMKRYKNIVMSEYPHLLTSNIKKV